MYDLLNCSCWCSSNILVLKLVHVVWILIQSGSLEDDGRYITNYGIRFCRDFDGLSGYVSGRTSRFRYDREELFVLRRYSDIITSVSLSSLEQIDKVIL